MSRAASPSDLVAAARAAGIADERVLEAISATPRAGFVPAHYVAAAYRDEPIPIGHRQVTTQPSLSARMIEGLHLASGDHVLEIGTGLGFQTALLARLAARVISIERWPDLADQARRNLARQGLGNAQVLAGDGSRGLPEGAPYDAILVSAAFPQVPAPLSAQLRIGGRQLLVTKNPEAIATVLRDRPEGFERTARMNQIAKEMGWERKMTEEEAEAEKRRIEEINAACEAALNEPPPEPDPGEESSSAGSSPTTSSTPPYVSVDSARTAERSSARAVGSLPGTTSVAAAWDDPVRNGHATTATAARSIAKATNGAAISSVASCDETHTGPFPTVATPRTAIFHLRT